MADATKDKYDVIASGVFTTAGGDATESISVEGMTTTDIPMVTMNTVGASPVTVKAATAAAGAITVTMSADPSTDHKLSYIVLRQMF